MTKEKDIVHESNGFYVHASREYYTVFRPSKCGMYAVSDSTYGKTPDGLSIAIARCDYLAKRKKTT